VDIDQRLEALRVKCESLHARVRNLVEGVQRHDGEISDLLAATRQDAENIRALARRAGVG
jgi:hypothetical protein